MSEDSAKPKVSHRKKARNLKFKENCDEYLLLKKKTNSFKDV